MKRRLVITLAIKDDASFVEPYKSEPVKLFDQVKSAIVPLLFTMPALSKVLKLFDLGGTTVKYEEGESKTKVTSP